MNEIFRAALDAARPYLPDGTLEIGAPPDVYLILFEPGGSGGQQSVVSDLLRTMASDRESNIEFLGHELHHLYRGRIPDSPLAEDWGTYAWAVQPLTRMQEEGIASLIDKQGYFDANRLSREGVSEEDRAWVEQFTTWYASTPERLAVFDSLVAGVASGTVSTEDAGSATNDVIPFGGHEEGMYMATAIVEVSARLLACCHARPPRPRWSSALSNASSLTPSWPAASCNRGPWSSCRIPRTATTTACASLSTTATCSSRLASRHHRERARDLGSHAGSILRLVELGRPPADNPFVEEEDALPETWSYGHRNPQGLAVEPGTGRLWSHEHGPREGDELNLIRRGGNYGWPVISYGWEYEGGPIGQGIVVREGMQQPAWVWTPSIGAQWHAVLRGRRLSELARKPVHRIAVAAARHSTGDRRGRRGAGGAPAAPAGGPCPLPVTDRIGHIYLGNDQGQILRLRPPGQDASRP